MIMATSDSSDSYDSIDSISDDKTTAMAAPSQIPEEISRSQKTLRTLGWVALSLFFLMIFTVFKLPEQRLKNFIQGNISSALGNYGISYTATQSSLSYLFGISYKLKDITLNPAPPDPSFHIEALQVSPSLLTMLTGKLGGKVYLENDGGDLTLSLAMRRNEGSTSFRLKSLNLGKLGVLLMAAGIKGSLVTNGEGSLSGNFNSPATWSGAINLTLSKINFENQTIQGFNIPAISVSEGTINLEIDKGKAIIKTLKLGKSGGSDDIVANVTGDITLAKTWEASTMNLKAKFTLSEKILKSFVLLDALLGQGKQPDGSYAFNITGPLNAPYSAPAGASP